MNDMKKAQRYVVYSEVFWFVAWRVLLLRRLGALLVPAVLSIGVIANLISTDAEEQARAAKVAASKAWVVSYYQTLRETPKFYDLRGMPETFFRPKVLY